MSRGTKPKPALVLALTLAVLLAFQIGPTLLQREPPLGSAFGIHEFQNQRDPTRCDAVGNNWTKCYNAFASNNSYAYANDTAGGGGFPSVAANSTSTEPADVTSHTVSLPVGIVSGNLLLVFFAVDGNPTVTFPAGWTVFFNVANGAQVRLVLAYRQADGTEGATITITTSAAEQSAHASYRITGHEDPATQAPEASAGATGTNNAPDPGALTPTGGAKDYLWLAVAGQDHVDSAFLAAPANYLDLLTIGGGNEFGVNVGSAERQLNAASEDPGTFSTDKVEEWAAATAVVHPSSPGPGKNDTAWRDFGFTLNATDVISSVEVGVEWFRISSEPILNVTVSWDGGLTWAANQTATNKSADDNMVEFLDFTSATAWDSSKLDDTNFRARVGTNASGARLDYVTVRVAFMIDHNIPSSDDTDNTLGATVISDPPEIISFDITNAADVSLMHTQLDVSVRYYYNLTLREPDSWSDVQWANIRTWFDGGTELTFAAQTTGANYRLDLNYTNVAPVSSPALSEWSVAEGNFVYDSANSSIFTNVLNENYTFKLAFLLNNQVRWGADPVNQGVGAYNDLNSWNAEVRAKDVSNPDTIRRSDGGNVFYEFGVFLWTFVSIGSNWDAGPISPGASGTTPVVTVTHEANRDYRMSVWFTSHLISGPNTITVNNINITAAGDPADDITSDIPFAGLGFANREFIWGTVTNQAHNVSADQETTGVQFRVNVPFATPVGSYVANLTIRVEAP